MEQVKITLERITPKLAAEWLQRNFEDNRTLRPGVVSRYAADMKDGRWTQNGETLKFDQYGNLMDGQHRLEAIVLSGKTVDMFVAHNISDESVANLDIGARRSAADALRVSGVTLYLADQSALAKKILAIQLGSQAVMSGKENSGVSFHTTPTHAQIVQYVLENDLTKYCIEGKGYYDKQISRILKPSDWIFLCWHLPKISATKYADFLQKLATLEDIPAQNPVRFLFKKLQEKMSPAQKLIEVEAAFDAFVLGKSRYQVSRQSTGRANASPAPTYTA